MTFYYDDNRGTDRFTLQDFEPSFQTKLNATISEAWLESYGPTAVDFIRKSGDDGKPKLSADDVKKRITESGLKPNLTPKDGEYSEDQLSVVLERQRELAMAKDVRERTPWDWGSPVRGVAMFGAGIADPVNLATAFVPWTKAIPIAASLRAAALSSSAATRFGGRAAFGAADAGISTALLEPAYAFARRDLGDDYDAYDSLANIAFGTAFGGGIHSVGGAGADAFRRVMGRTQPFARFEGVSVGQIEQLQAWESQVKAFNRRFEGKDDPSLSEARAEAQAKLDDAFAAFTPEMKRATGFADPDATGRAALDAQNAGRTAAADGSSTNLSPAPGITRLKDGSEINIQSEANPTAFSNLTRMEYGEPVSLIAKNASGEEVGRLTYMPEGGPIDVVVRESDRRKGIGNALYDALEAAGGKIPDENSGVAISNEARALRASRENRRQEIQTAGTTIARVDPETREAALRASVAQSAEGRFIDVDAIVRTDPAAGTATANDVIDAAELNQRPDAIRTADFEASAMVDENNATAPKWDGVADAEQALSEADTILNDTIKAGDDAYKYSRAQGGVDKPGVGVAEGNKLGFEPDLRVKVPLGRIKQPEKALLLIETNNKNAERQIAALDGILKKFPKADESPQEWSRMMAYAFASDEVPVPPYAFLRDINSPNAAAKLRQLTPGQIADADHGFKQAEAFRKAYVGKELNVVVTGKLFMWSFLSRGVSPYTQEALFIDAFPGVDEWIRKAAKGELTEADFPAYEAWAKSVAPAGSGQPGAGATHNLNAFGKSFLFKMGQTGADGISHIQRLHNMMEDPNATGAQIRREFMKFGEGVGIDNKVVSFTLLVAGFDDVMVLDRVQIRQLWDDGRFNGKNLYDGRKNAEGKQVTGSALSDITYGARGLLIYEAVERALQKHIRTIYKELGRENQASVGRYHWESWVADSQQEASHGTLSAILPDARGDDQAINNVTAKQGEYGAYEYGAMYGRGLDGVAYFAYNTPDGRQFEFSVPAFRAFLADIKKPGTGVVPGKFKVTESGNAPWYTRPEVNQERLTDVANQYADRRGGTGAGGAGEGAGAVQRPAIGEAVPDSAGPRYARGTEPGLRADVQLSEALRLAFGRSTQSLVDAGQVRIVSRPDQIPGGPHPADVKGATAPDGLVYIVAENVTPDEARGMLLHEVGVHVGMRNMLGDDLFESVLKQLDEAITRGDDWAKEARASVPADTAPGLVREEQLAYLVQNSPELTLVKRIVAAVRVWAYTKFEFARDRIKLTDADFRSMAVSALHHAARGGEQAGAMVPAFARDAVQTATKAFQDWFGGSKVVDVNGQPMRVFHGTNASFSEFSNQFMGEGDGAADFGDGFYFTNKADAANTYATGEGGNVMPVYLSIKNPATNEVMLSPAVQRVLDDGMGFESVSDVLAEMGYDGIAYTHPSGIEYVVFKPEQIKSATGNAGTFDPANPDIRYARGQTPDPSTAADELKPFDEAVKRAKAMTAVLRAAADKLDDDAQAAAAMKAAMPDVTTAEIADLLAQLRSSVKGLRGMARSMASAVTAEDRAGILQTDAMRAADTLANNLVMAAVIEKRNAALNLNARLKASSFVNQFRDKGLDFEGFAALLVGSERVRTGARISIDSEAKAFRGEWVGGMIADVERLGLMREFTSGAFDKDIYDALWRMGQKNADMTGLSPQAIKMAEVINKYQTDARNTRNRFGAWIRDLQGYITRQSHDMFKIREVTDKDWIDFVLPRLDIQKMTRLGLISADDPIASLRAIYDDFSAGVHMKAQAGEADTVALGRGANLAKRESVSRSLYFKDGVAAYEYNTRFGSGRLAESVLQGLDGAARSAALLKNLGTNPEVALTRLLDDYENSLVGEPARRETFRGQRKQIMNMLAHVDGTANIPGSVTGAKIGSFLRALQSMAKLGGAVISSVTDLAGYAAEMRYAQDKNLLSGVTEGIGKLIDGRPKGERADVLASLGVFHESVLGSVAARFDSPDLVGGKMAAAMQMFFKFNGLAWWTESLRDGAALSHANYLASNTSKAWDRVPDELKRMLQLYNIDAGKWDILRMATMQEADGKAYMTPEALRTVPREALENYITQVGRVANDATVANLVDDLSQALRVMAIDRAHHAILEPGARTRAFMLRGTQPGTVPGEILRYIGQFKSFSVAMIQMTLGREIYGRGYDTLGEYLRKGHGDMLGLASYIALTGVMGYAAMSIKDLLKGKEPRPVDDPRTWAASLIQGGGLGLYGDFLFGEYNRMGRTFTASAVGPVAGLADTAFDLFSRARRGDDLAGAALNAALQNTPFMNLFYVRPVLDYLIIYRLQEAINPGYLRRMERRVERENGQSFILPPSQIVR